MSDKKGFMGLAALAAAGAGAAMLMKKTREINEEENLHVKETTTNYRNTERGKHDKNSKGIYYSNGNYEAFARPEKPCREKICLSCRKRSCFPGCCMLPGKRRTDAR